MASGPLNGVRVLEFGQIFAAPLGCQMLSDLGAEVIKVEPLQGEPWRTNAQFIPGESKGFQAMNRGKLSLSIDMRQPAGLEAIHRVVRTVDVVVVNYRSDVSAKLRIDYESLRAVKPDLVYLDNTAFGRQGELAERPGYDLVAQALSGIMAAIGKTGEGGEPLGVLSPPFLDTTTAYAIVGGVCAALYHKAMTGEGQLVETSLLINALTIHTRSFVSNPAADAAERADFFEARERAREENTPYADFVTRGGVPSTVQGVYYRCYVTRDGAVAVGALSASLRAKLRATMPFSHNRDEPGYDPTDPQQQAIDRALVQWMEATFRAQTSEYWEQFLSAGGVPVSRVNFVQELLEHPQVVANGYVVEIEHELTGTQYVAAPPWKMSATPPRIQGASPPLGRDTDRILAGAGYDEDEIEQLHRAGVVR